MTEITSSTAEVDTKNGMESKHANQNVEEISDPHLAMGRHSSGDYRLETVDPKTLSISKHNVRKREIQGSTWEEFLEDIEKNGVLNPPQVTPSDQVVAGQRRVLAAKKVGLEEIYIHRLKEEPSEAEAISMSLRENHHRESVYQDDRLDAIIRLRDIFDQDKQKVADSIGVKRYTVQAWLSMEVIRRQVPNIGKVGGIEKQLTTKGILQSPAYMDSSPEEKTRLVEEKLKDKNQPELRAILKSAKAGKRVPDQSPGITSLIIPNSLYSFCLKRLHNSLPNLHRHILFLLEDWARDEGWKE